MIETASAPSRLAAISKLVRVRVEASKNRLTIILPRSVSSFFKDWLCMRLKILGPRQDRFDLGAVQLFDSEQSRAWHLQLASLAATFSTSSTFSIPSISWNFTSMISMSRGLHRAADEARLDRQLAMAAVDQHQQLHARRPAVIEQRVQRGANGAARCTARRPSG